MSELDSKNLNDLSRDALIARAAALGVTRPELLTRVELRDEIVRLTETDAQARSGARGWLGVARDLVASVVEQRLNLPDAADLIRGVNLHLPKNVAPVATVTLAEIYAAQGHLTRAVKLLDEVLTGEPDHEAARLLRDRLLTQSAPEPEPSVQAEEDLETIDSSEVEPIEAPGIASFPAELSRKVAPPDIVVSALPDVSELHNVTLQSEIPGDPEIPDDPEIPEDPEAPDDPRVPDDPQVPDDPEVPDYPDVPEEPRIPEEPQIPQVPQMREHSEIALQAATEAITEYDCLIYRRSDVNIVCHWSMASHTWDNWSARGDGQWVLRVLRISPATGTLTPVETNLNLPGTSGEVIVNEIGTRDQVRMAVGWECQGRFFPVVIGVEVAGNSPRDVSIAWRPIPGLNEPDPEIWLDCARRAWRSLSMSEAQ